MSIDTAVDTTCWYYWRVHWHLMKRWVNLKLNDWTTDKFSRKLKRKLAMYNEEFLNWHHSVRFLFCLVAVLLVPSLFFHFVVFRNKKVTWKSAGYDLLPTSLNICRNGWKCSRSGPKNPPESLGIPRKIAENRRGPSNSRRRLRSKSNDRFTSASSSSKNLCGF